jgi:HEAT repeat protein
MPKTDYSQPDPQDERAQDGAHGDDGNGDDLPLLPRAEEIEERFGGENYHIVDLAALAGDIDADLAEGEAALPLVTMSAEELLLRLAEDEAAVPEGEYFALSDLTHRQADVLRRLWAAIPVGRRRHVLRILIAAQDEVLVLDLNALLAVALHDADAQNRRAAVEALDDATPQPELLGRLIHLAREDDDGEVRAAAARALGAFVLAAELDEIEPALGLRAVDALENILINAGEPVAVQAGALESIAYAGDAGVRQFIEDAYYSPLEDLRLSALRAMGRSADARWRKMVRAELSNPSPEMRAEAAVAAGELEIKSALPELLDLLEDEEQTVRAAAMFALGHIGGRTASEALRAIAAGDDPDEAEMAELALEEMLFYTGGDAATASLLEGEDEEEYDDADPWAQDGNDLGEYEDDRD